jgi:hypothetical protein
VAPELPDGPAPDRAAAGRLSTPPYDPLRLCVYSTIALLAWLGGPFAVLFFAGLGLAGYVRARRAGLTRSKCVLRDTRLVIAYLSVLAVVGAVAAGRVVLDVLGVLDLPG